MGLIKPDLSAYGNGTVSICPGPSYCQFSGTSSATPHVSGAIALMLQANPDATPEQLAQALMTTAQHRGDPGKNNVTARAAPGLPRSAVGRAWSTRARVRHGRGTAMVCSIRESSSSCGHGGEPTMRHRAQGS
jgi:subtilisin family serine protease